MLTKRYIMERLIQLEVVVDMLEDEIYGKRKTTVGKKTTKKTTKKAK